ncbi:MAG TPA: hypothetical protein VL981_00460 [Candidatus Methylacidiphilales bacterium]|nr:hypothetical protein [Candidatus Methylacidiphilales bacterium]
MARVFAIAADKGLVGTGVTGARRVLLPAVLKTHNPTHCFVANEYVANILGRFLGLPLPPGALTKSDDGLGFASLDFDLTGESLPPLDPGDCYKKMPDQSTGLVMFDIFIANPDRHNQNVCATLRDKPYDMIAFDHGHALFGHDKTQGIKRLEDLRDRLGISGGSATKQNRHCLLDEILDSGFFEKWMIRIKTIPDHLIDASCEDVRDKGLIDFAEAAALKTFLKYRRDNFQTIVMNHKDEFKGIKQWGLPL